MMLSKGNGWRIMAVVIAAAIFVFLTAYATAASSTGTTVYYIVQQTPYGVDVNSTSDQSVSNNSNATYTIVVTNNGTAIDNYSISLSNIDNATTAYLNQTTVMNLSPGTSFNLTLFVNDISPGNYSVNVTATSDNDANVTDTVTVQTEVIAAPLILTTTVSPYAVINGSNVTLYVDASNFEAVWAEMIRPDNSTVNITLTDEANTIYLDTGLIGIYNITFYANNSIGDTVTVKDYFEAFKGVIIDLDIIDSNLTGVNSSIISYYRNGSVAINFSSNGSYIISLPDSLLDMEFYAYSNDLIVYARDQNISVIAGQDIGMDLVNQTNGYLVTYSIEPDWLITDATVRISYDGLDYNVEDNLRLWKCEDFNFTTETCNGTWTEVTGMSVQDFAGDYFSIDVTGFSGFAVDEYVPPSTPPPGGGGGGGGGGTPTEKPCIEDWTCGPWNSCFNGQQTRECVDRNGCDTDEYRPVTRISCFVIVTPEWQCNEWSACTADGLQTRVCIDNVSSGIRRGIPKTLQSCSFDFCNDGIWNNGEEGIDCGGRCEPCRHPLVERAFAEANILCLLMPILAMVLVVLLIMIRGSKLPEKTTRVFGIVNIVLLLGVVFMLLPSATCPDGPCMAIADTMPIIDEILLFFAATFAIALLESVIYLAIKRKHLDKGKHKSHPWHSVLFRTLFFLTSVISLFVLARIVMVFALGDPYDAAMAKLAIIFAILLLAAAIVIMVHRVWKKRRRPRIKPPEPVVAPKEVVKRKIVWKMPKLRMPKIKIPRLPKVHIPKISLPTIRLPKMPKHRKVRKPIPVIVTKTERKEKRKKEVPAKPVVGPWLKKKWKEWNKPAKHKIPEAKKAEKAQTEYTVPTDVHYHKTTYYVPDVAEKIQPVRPPKPIYRSMRDRLRKFVFVTVQDEPKRQTKQIAEKPIVKKRKPSFNIGSAIKKKTDDVKISIDDRQKAKRREQQAEKNKVKRQLESEMKQTKQNLAWLNKENRRLKSQKEKRAGKGMRDDGQLMDTLKKIEENNVYVDILEKKLERLMKEKDNI